MRRNDSRLYEKTQVGVTIDNLLLMIDDWRYMKYFGKRSEFASLPVSPSACRCGRGQSERFAFVSMVIVVLAFGCQANKKPTSAGSPLGEAEGNIVEERKMVTLETTKGNIVIEVNETAAPVTSTNFLRYVQDGFYDGTIFHRVIPDFMIQGGGFTSDMKEKQTHEPIVNEAKNGLKNTRGTLAMARTNDPNSATAQFFINLINNDYLNYSGPRNPGYAVFAKVVEGMDVVDAIARVKTTSKHGHEDVPVEPVIIKSARVVLGK
jgi:cyclophilin family peptidyl-prolyl cis-trans isomerase